MSEIKQDYSRNFTLIVVLFVLLVIVGVYYQNPGLMTGNRYAFEGYSPNYYGGGYHGYPFYGMNGYVPYGYGYPSYVPMVSNRFNTGAMPYNGTGYYWG